MYVVYLTMYCGKLLPKWYIGSSTEERVVNGYNGSVCSKKYSKLYYKEQTENKHLFRTKILSRHQTRQEAINEELRLQKMHKVVKNNRYFNESYAQANGCFARDKSGEYNPMYGRGYKLIGKNNGRHSSNYDYKTSDVGKKISKALKNSEKNKKGLNPASKEYYVFNHNTLIFENIEKGYLCEYCREHDVKYTTLYNTIFTNKPISIHPRWGKPNGIGLQLFEGTI